MACVLGNHGLGGPQLNQEKSFPLSIDVEDDFRNYPYWGDYNDPNVDITLTFGPDPPDKDIHKPYWWNTWDQIMKQSPGGSYLDPATYAWVFQDGGKTIVQYWFYYPFNDWGNNHESDWEHISVRLTEADPDNALIQDVCYYFHKQYKIRGGDHIEVYDETHPKVYVGGEYCWLPWKNSNDSNIVNELKDNTANYSGKSLLGINLPESNISSKTKGNDIRNGHCSGGSYWRAGDFRNTGQWGGDERISNGEIFYPDDIELVCLDFADNQLPYNYWFWHLFPGKWGRPGWFLDMNLSSSGIRSPYWGKEGKRHWIEEGYRPYGHDLFTEGNSGESSSNSSPAFPFALHQTAPNPAKLGSVAFAFSVPKTCEAKLTVYDIKGRIVSVPFEEKIVPGEYSAELSTASLPAGIYLYRLEAGSDVAVKKMVITK